MTHEGHFNSAVENRAKHLRTRVDILGDRGSWSIFTYSASEFEKIVPEQLIQ